MRKIMITLLALAMTTLAQAQNVREDDTYRTGKLKNGLTYYIRHNGKDAGLADFYIAHNVGSILEEPNQRGLAHFLEHMAFNGSKHFRGKGKSLGIVPWCESVGIKFGTNLNAYTSTEQTVYNIKSAPVTREQVVDSVLLILFDWTHYLLLTDEEIDKERGVIHEEWRTRSSKMATQRMIERMMPTIYKGTKYEDCLPIGNMDVVDNFEYSALRDYYKKWYRPDLQAIIIAGDIDVDKMEKKVQKLFSKVSPQKHPAERVHYPVNDNDEMIVAIDKDSEQPIMLANLYMKRETASTEDKKTVGYQRDGYVEGLITSMLNERYQELQHQDVPPCLSATAHNGSFFVSKTKDAFSISFGCRQENVKGSFDAAIGIAEQARQHGFNQGELSRAKAIYMASAERKYAERNDRRNSYYIRKALLNFTDNEPIISAEEDLRLYKMFDEEVTLDEVNKAVKDIITDKNQVFIMYAPDKEGVDVPDASTIKEWVEAAQNKAYSPWEDAVLSETLMETLPTPGSIVKVTEPSGSENADSNFGFTRLDLSNGVSVYVKPTEFSKDQISMRFYGDGGTQYFPDSDVPNFPFLSSAITKAGLDKYTEMELRKMLTGKIANVTPGIGDETQAINGSCSVKDLKTMMELTYLYFTSPRKDSTAFNSEINRMRSFLANRNANPRVDYNDSLMKILYDSPRIQPTTLEMLDETDYNRIYDIYKECFSNANGWNMVLIGNIDMDALKPLLEQYIASLPSKAEKTFAGKKLYGNPDIVGGDKTVKFTKPLNTPSATVNIYYTFDEPCTLRSDIALDLLARSLRIAYTDTIREEKGGTYGVSVSQSLDESSTPHALVKISFQTDPTRYDELIPLVYSQISNIATYGPEKSSIDKAKKYLRKTYDQNITYNDYWSYVMYNYLRHGMDYHTNYLQELDSVTENDVKQVAKDMLDAKRRIEVTMLPE